MWTTTLTRELTELDQFCGGYRWAWFACPAEVSKPEQIGNSYGLRIDYQEI